MKSTHKSMLIGAAVVAALIVASGKGLLGSDAKNAVSNLLTNELIPGVPF